MGICAGSHGTRVSLCNLATAEMKGEAKHRLGGLSVFLLPFSREIALAYFLQIVNKFDFEKQKGKRYILVTLMTLLPYLFFFFWLRWNSHNFSLICLWLLLLGMFLRLVPLAACVLVIHDIYFK